MSARIRSRILITIVTSSLTVFFHVLSTLPCEAANIDWVPDKYSNFDAFVGHRGDSFSRAMHLRHFDGGRDWLTFLNPFMFVDEPNSDTPSCAKPGLAFDEKAIYIEGSIEKGDEQKFVSVINDRSWMSSERKLDKCADTIIVNSLGGDLEAAMKIGDEISKRAAFVIVEDGGNCISACIFILMSAGYTTPDNVHFGKAFAFSDSHIGVHWPGFAGKDKTALNRFAKFEADKAIDFLGNYWISIDKFLSSAARSPYMTLALLNSMSYGRDKFYLIDSTIERKIAGITTILLPWDAVAPQRDDESLRSYCLSNMVNANTSAIASNISRHLADIFWYFLPSNQKICFIDTASENLRILVLDYPADKPSAEEHGDETYSEKELKASLKVEAAKLLGLKNGRDKKLIDRYIDKMEFGTTPDTWSIFTALNHEYSCMGCGRLRGTLMFDPRSDCRFADNAQAKIEDVLAKHGVGCDRQLNAYLFARLLFDHTNNFNTIEDGEPVRFMDNTNTIERVRVSPDCPTSYQVCSTRVGTLHDSNVVTEEIESTPAAR